MCMQVIQVCFGKIIFDNGNYFNVFGVIRCSQGNIGSGFIYYYFGLFEGCFDVVKSDGINN